MSVELAPFPVLAPLFLAAVLAALEHITNRHRILDLLSLATVAAVLVLDLLLLKRSFSGTVVYWFGAWTPMQGFPVGIAFVVDPVAALLALFAAFLTAMGFLYSWHRFKAVGTYYHTLMLLFLASMQGFCLTGDLFNMFVFFELMGVTAYALTGYKIEDSGPLEGALNFAVMNSIGGLMVLFGIGLLYGITGGLNLAWAGAFLEGKAGGATVAAAFVLLSLGFLVKGAIVPFHFWLPDAHAVAPTPASVLFSGIMVQLGLYAVARIYWVVFSDALDPAPLRLLLLSAGAATALLGAVMALLQRHLKRMLAFSTVSHSGMMLSGIALMDPSALAGTLLYLVGHGAVKGALFVCTGIILYHYNSVDEETLRGKCLPLKATGALFCLCGVALAGLPPFGTWAGKGVLEQSAGSLGYGWLPPLFLICSGITGGVVLRAGGSLFYGVGSANFLSSSAPSSGKYEEPEAFEEKGGTPRMMLLPLVLLVVVAVGAGALPQLQSSLAEGAARLADGKGYRATVLKGGAYAAAALPQPDRPGLAMGVAAALAAVAVAGFFFIPPDAVRPLRGLRRALEGPVALLRSLHSGYIGDYTAWFLAGAAVMTLFAIMSQ
ncbi:complex I subunit 5 family protein [Citrifermentans bremense]|uniref:complex I subunit 5 family protein n=1 Tax=Citrifermentans bremense TaxID=60035 RepID=UPI0004799BD4|nr:complex I subunit 5 family protein [Citrifermentans bremense]